MREKTPEVNKEFKYHGTRFEEIQSDEALANYFALHSLAYHDESSEKPFDEATERQKVLHDLQNPSGRSAPRNKTMKNLLGQGAMKIYGFYEAGGPNKDRLVAAGMVTTSTEAGGSPQRAYIAADVTRPEWRGQRLMPDLTDLRINWAKAQGCKEVACQVVSDNIPGLLTKLKSGFVLTDMSGDDKDGETIFHFGLVKKIEAKHAPKKILEESATEVALSDRATLLRYFADGWKGVRLESAGNRDDNDPAHWMVALEKYFD